MTIVVACTLVLLGLIGAAALMLFAGYRMRDVLVLAFLTSIVMYLSRWDLYLQHEIHGRPFVTFHWYLLGAALVFAAARVLFPEPPPMRFGPLLLAGFGFAALAMMSGVLNGGAAGAVSAVHVLVVTVLPALAAATCVALIPRDSAASRRLRVTFILLAGVLTPAMVVLSALAPNQIGSLLGWGTIAAGRATGFVRGWSPLGSPITTGTAMILAYGLAMHEVIGTRKRRYIAVLLLVGLAMLFTLARSVLLMFAIFHLVYFWSAIRRQPMRVIGVGMLLVVLAVPVVYKLSERFSFERFLEGGGASTDLRASSALGALAASLRNPVLGNGPGLLYEGVRQGETVRIVRGSREVRTIMVAGRVSALEPHNVYLLVAAEHGWVALGLFMAILLICWRRTRLRNFLADVEDRSMSSAFHALWLALLFMLLTASNPMIKEQIAVLFWFFAFLGLHWRATMERKDTWLRAYAAVPVAGPPVPRTGGICPAAPV